MALQMALNPARFCFDLRARARALLTGRPLRPGGATGSVQARNPQRWIRRLPDGFLRQRALAPARREPLFAGRSAPEPGAPGPPRYGRAREAVGTSKGAGNRGGEFRAVAPSLAAARSGRGPDAESLPFCPLVLQLVPCV